MAVTRISKESLEDLLKGKVKEDATCVLKFYSNECHLCHALQDYFVAISDIEKYNDLHFFAYNIDDNPKLISFKNSIERAVYMASPFPLAPTGDASSKQIIFEFRVDAVEIM